ncbi:Na+/H+ antiporter subunit E [Corticicoccus populi]|uniref:Na+/H+ antiporter subunit E n=1 Tax=Corticicoccus populi TaxID=1812821 RepID=A0ABW5WTN2_9STAP
MPFQIIVNLLIAIIWMFLHNSLTFSNFLFGYIIGIFVLYILRYFLGFDFYFRKTWAFIKLILIFIRELIKANLDVLKVVMSRELHNKPGIVEVDTRLETNFEIATLAALISLTPGTVSMDFSLDNKKIYVHSLDVPNKIEMIADIRDSLEKAILEVTK